MSHARRYHEPGVGSRTGMRVADDAFDVNEFFQAGRRAMNGETSRHSMASSRRSSVASSSSSEMMIVQDTSGLSPRSTIRRSMREASSSNLSSASLDKTHDLLNDVSLTGTAAKRLQDAQKNALMSIANRSTSSTTRYSSSPSPWVVNEGENANRRGLNAGLEARRMARLKQVQTQQSAHRIASLEQPDVGSKKGRRSGRTSTMESEQGDLTATLLRHDDEEEDRSRQQQGGTEESNNTEQQEVIDSDVDRESNASWPAGEDVMPPEDEIEAFDGSSTRQDRLQETSSMIIDDVSEAGEASSDERHDEEEYSEQEQENEDQASDEEVSGEDPTEDDEEEDMDLEQPSEEISVSISKSQTQSISLDDESQDAESEVSEDESEQQEVSESQSEEETEASVVDAGDAEDAEEFAFPADDNESLNGYGDGDVTPTNAITSLVHDNSHVVEDEHPVYKRSVLSERDSNAPHTTAKDEKKKPVKGKKRGKYQHDDDESAQQRQVRHRHDGLHGEIVERVPYAQQRRLTGMESGEDGVRRGTRYRFKPLEYWRGERARYGRPSLPKSKDKEQSSHADAEGDDDENVGDDTTIDADAFESHVRAAPPPVTVLKEIIRIPRAEGEGTFSGMKLPRKGSQNGDGAAKGPRKGATAGGKQALNPAEPTRNVEDGWDKDTQTHMTVIDAATQEEAERQIACTSEQLRPRMAAGCRFGFEKVFVVEDFMATGVMFLLVDGEKPIKNSKDNYYTFVVLEGCVRVRVHRTDFVIAPQGMFFVPRGNDYSITNISKRVARLAFTQAKSPSSRAASGLPSSD